MKSFDICFVVAFGLASHVASAAYVVTFRQTSVSLPSTADTPAFDWAEGLPDPTSLAPTGGLTRGSSTSLTYIGWGTDFDESKYVGFKVSAAAGQAVELTTLVFTTEGNAAQGLTSYRWGYRMDDGSGFGAWTYSQTYTAANGGFGTGTKVWNFPDFSVTGTVEFGLFATASSANAEITALKSMLTLNGPGLDNFSPFPTGEIGKYGSMKRYSIDVSEASAVEYNRDTNTLFSMGDEGTALVEMTKTGDILGSMNFDYNRTPRTTRALDDSEGISYLGNGKFMIADERRNLGVVMSYEQGAFRTLEDLAPTSYAFGPYDGNTGLEGVAYDVDDGTVWGVKESGPTRIYHMTGMGTPSQSVTQPIPFRYLNRMGIFQLSEIHLLSHSAAFPPGHPRRKNILVLAREQKKVIEIERSGKIVGYLDFSGLIGRNTVEGMTLDDDGTLYLCAEGYAAAEDPVDRISGLFVFTPPQTPLEVMRQNLTVGQDQVAGALTWRSEIGARYVIEYTTDLSASSWEEASVVYTAVSAMTTGSISPRAKERKGFFRVRKLDP